LKRDPSFALRRDPSEMGGDLKADGRRPEGRWEET